MSAEVMRRRAELLARYRWAFAFALAIALTVLFLPRRPHGATLAYDLVPAVALAGVWLAAGVGLGFIGRYWARRATAVELPVARAQR